MADLEQQLHEDRALRNAAKRLVKSDLDFLKTGMAQKDLGQRVASRAKDGAVDIAENAAEYADDHRTQVGTSIAVAVLAVAGWIFRDRLSDAIYNLFQDKGQLEETSETAEQVADEARSFED